MHQYLEGDAINFTEERTREILDVACRSVGIEAAEPKLLRHQSNAVYLVETATVVVKIARPDDAIANVRRTVDLTKWLVARRFPTVPLCDVGQPVIIGGSAVTFWRYLPQRKPISAADIAGPLRELHELPEPPSATVPTLPALDAISAIRRSLNRESLLSTSEHDFLLDRCTILESQLTELCYERPSCLLHGDAQHRNTLWDGEQAVLADWESAVIGPAEWDLVTIEVHCRRFLHPEETYQAFCHIYGRDVRQWNGYETMRDVRELRMIATNARKSAPGSRSAAEVRRRVTQLQQGQDSPWSIL